MKYLSADYGGLRFGAMFGFGGQAGDFARGRNYGFGAQYRNGPFTLSAAYESENNRLLELAGYVGLPTFMGTPIDSGTPFVADNLKNLGMGASYQLGHVLLRALFTQSRIDYGGTSANVNNYDVGANWQITPFNSINGGVSLSRFEGGRWITPIITDVYSLSKRTSLYSTFLYQFASGNGAVASMPGAGQSASRCQASVSVGIQHWF
ncbi:porin [Paraburkholderia sp. J63]|uniref:porin n=1 Tax=Paraburkholderia sp. J63 TaxID=2805434 RepID=UPI002ABDD8CF|nr:porin [Paraburkholderia sp. J63]